MKSATKNQILNIVGAVSFLISFLALEYIVNIYLATVYLQAVATGHDTLTSSGATLYVGSFCYGLGLLPVFFATYACVATTDVLLKFCTAKGESDA